MDFNKRSRQATALLASSSGILLQLVQILGNFVYRTIFLHFLSVEYLGINGLFTNVLQLFSLAELGIGTAILYSMYAPFARQDTHRIGALIRFYKQIYNFLAALVVVIGLAIYPFIGHLVNASELPADVNLTVIYFLFVARSAASYLFVYKQSLLTADQQNHKISLMNCLLQVASYGIRIAMLAIAKDYHLMLLADVGTGIVFNGAFSIWITRKYRAIFRTTDKLSKEGKKEIFKHTYGLLCHRIGHIVVISTDSIILSKFVSLAAVGLYSNYATVVTAITNVLSKLLYDLVPSVANYVVTKTKEESYVLFRRVLFVNLWLSSFTTVCLFLLLDSFVILWLGEDYLLPLTTVIMICMQHYMQSARLTANTFIESCGLFHKDKIRPLIESALNLIVSIVLVIKVGITGVFIGTVVSGLLTYFWRQPYLIHKHFFQKSTFRYWMIQLFWAGLTAAICVGGHFLFSLLGNGFVPFLVKILLAVIVPNLVILLFTFYTDDFRYAVNILFRKISKKLKRSNSGES